MANHAPQTISRIPAVARLNRLPTTTPRDLSDHEQPEQNPQDAGSHCQHGASQVPVPTPSSGMMNEVYPDPETENGCPGKPYLLTDPMPHSGRGT
jgi:hypothetical protein